MGDAERNVRCLDGTLKRGGNELEGTGWTNWEETQQHLGSGPLGFQSICHCHCHWVSSSIFQFFTIYSIFFQLHQFLPITSS